MGRCALALRPHEPGRVAIGDHYDSVVLIGQRAVLGQLGEVAVHREDAIGRDHDVARAVGSGGFQLCLKIGHVGIGVAVALCLAEPDAVDDRGVVQGVGDNGILFAQKRFEEAAIGVETGGEEDRIVHAQKPGQRGFQFPVQVLRPADEPHGRHAKAPWLHRGLGGASGGL